jgi:hypothetical protein
MKKYFERNTEKLRKSFDLAQDKLARRYGDENFVGCSQYISLLAQNYVRVRL